MFAKLFVFLIDQTDDAFEVNGAFFAVNDVRRHHPLVLDALLPSAHEGRVDDEHDPLGVGGARACDERTRERLLDLLVEGEVGVDLVEQRALLLHREQGERRAAATCLVRLSRRSDTLLELDAHRTHLVELEVARLALQRDVRVVVAVLPVFMCQKVEHPRALLQDSVVLEHEVRLERLALGGVADHVHDTLSVAGAPVLGL